LTLKATSVSIGEEAVKDEGEDKGKGEGRGNSPP
jgi:hypothetical protein